MGVPGDYCGLSEHRHLCEVHKNLLTDQQNLLLTVNSEEGRDLSVAEQFNALTNLHNETLAKIMERHAAVQDRLAAWEKYRLDQNRLLSWLKDTERERSRLQLRFIHLRRLDKVLARIHSLIEKLPTGEKQAESLTAQQESLLLNCDEALAASVRMEHIANTQRIANIRAGLETWKDFIVRIQDLNEYHKNQTTKITSAFQEVGDAINNVFLVGPCSLTRTREQLDSLQDIKFRLAGTTSDLESLGVTAEQLKECLSPSDMKSLNQHGSLLWQQHGDLEHQLALLAHRLSERCSLYGRWETRRSRLITWTVDAEDRIQNCDSVALDEPEEALKRVEYELQAEMKLKQKEMEWLQNTGKELIDVAEEKTEREKLQNAVDELNDRWSKLLNSGKARTNKLEDLMHTINNLERRIAEIRLWLGGIEVQLTEPFILEARNQNAVDKKLEDHDVLQKMIEAESGNVGEVLNLCEILLNDCDAWKASFNTDAIKSGMDGLERRWKAACVSSAERKRKIMVAWKLLQQLDKSKTEHEEWLVETETELKKLESNADDLSKEETAKTIQKAKNILNDIEARYPALQILEQSYSRLAKGGLEPDNLRSLTADVRGVIDRWYALKPRVEGLLSALQKEQKNYREFITIHGAAVVGLTQIDVRLTQLQHLATPEQQASPRRRLQQLAEIEKEFETLGATLERADKLALQMMEESHADDVGTIQELVDEYQLLWRDIKSRIAELRAQVESQVKIEVDEAVQVDTLKFEQDSAVQVDTLPRIVKITSCDAYLMELEGAIRECRTALDALEIAVTPEPTAGPGLPAAAKTLVSTIRCPTYRWQVFSALWKS